MSWLRPIPTGRPFHQLDRTDVHRWWRPVIGLAVMLFAAIAITTGFVVTLLVMVRAVTGEWLRFSSTGQNLFTNDLANLFALLGSLAILLPLVMVVTLVVNRRPAGSLASVEGRLRWRWMLLCLLPAAGYMGLTLAAFSVADAVHPSAANSGAWVGWHAFWLPALVVLLLVPFQAAAEEYIFRGWLLQAIGSFTAETRHRGGRLLAPILGSAWPAILLSTVPFIFGHAYTDWGILDIGAFAVVAGWITVKTGGIEAAIALHIVNNMTGMVLSAAEGDLSLEQGAVPLPDVIIDVVPLVLWAAVVLWMFGHTGSKRPMKRLS